VKVDLELNCWAHLEMISSFCKVVLLFSLFVVFIIVFYSEDNVRFRCGGKAK